MNNPSEFVDNLLDLPNGELVSRDRDLTPYYRNWGFTIYRTAYGPESDRHWQTVIDRINVQIFEDTLGYHPSDAAAKAFQLFRLDTRSDPSLDGLDADQLRQLYKDAVGGQPVGSGDQYRRVFLLVDKEVMEAISIKDFWVKCVQVDFAIEDYTPKKPNPRLGRGPRYLGWMKLKIRSVPQLWELLGLKEMVDIAPQTIGGLVLEVWDEQNSY